MLTFSENMVIQTFGLAVYMYVENGTILSWHPLFILTLSTLAFDQYLKRYSMFNQNLHFKKSFSVETVLKGDLLNNLINISLCLKERANVWWTSFLPNDVRAQSWLSISWTQRTRSSHADALYPNYIFQSTSKKGFHYLTFSGRQSKKTIFMHFISAMSKLWKKNCIKNRWNGSLFQITRAPGLAKQGCSTLHWKRSLQVTWSKIARYRERFCIF